MTIAQHLAGTPLVDLTGSSRTANKLEIHIESLPFTPGDITAGTENELQALVVGKRTINFPLQEEVHIVRKLDGRENSQVLGSAWRQ
ncbi:MAG TPA: hypothetical protein VN843_06230 [Anaerolineales bacterium]|nr:hypothetical protein [Anaerolineales bacterium]